MKSLILYHSKYGATEKVAKKIATYITNFDIKELGSSEYNLDDYQIIYVGCPIYYGSLHKQFKKFLNTHKSTLLTKGLRIFILGVDDKNYKQTISKNIDRDILLHGKVVHVGGAYEYEKMSFFDRFITKRVASFDTSVDLINEDKIKELVNYSHHLVP